MAALFVTGLNHTHGEGVGQPKNTIEPVTGYCVRVAYVIPSNRTAQSNAVAHLRNVLIQYRNWYRDQMERHGFGPKTFGFETEADGVTPKIHTVNVTETDDYLRGDLWDRTLAAATSAGVPVWTAKQVWWIIPEAHLEMADGSIIGGIALGASNGTGDSAGVAVTGSDGLARFAPEFATNDLAYDGQVIPALGPYPLKQNVSYPSFTGTTISSLSSTALGAGLHEMSHGFGLSHDFRNDRNFHGNLMGNGFRGWRGAQFPDRYPADLARASYGSLLALSVSRYFNPEGQFTDNIKPALNITTSGAGVLSNGLLRISFTASDDGGLHCALLALDGEMVDEMKLAGTNAAGTFATASFEPAQTNKYTISILDLQGNKQKTDVNLVPVTGANRAPLPSVKVTPVTAWVGQEVVLDAARTSDPNHATASLLVEWDLDGDGGFDTSPTTTKLATNVYAAAGDRLITARVTDPLGAAAISAPLVVRVAAPDLTIRASVNQLTLTWNARAAGFALKSASALNAPIWSLVDQFAVEADGKKNVTLTNLTGNQFFRLER